MLDDTVCEPHPVRAVLQIERTPSNISRNHPESRVHPEKRASGHQYYPRITIRTQPRLRVTVSCDWIIIVGDAVVRLSWSDAGVKPLYIRGFHLGDYLHKWMDAMVGMRAVPNKDRSGFSYNLWKMNLFAIIFALCELKNI